EFMPTYGSTPAERGILPAFANSAGKYFLQQSNWPYNTNNKEVTYNLFHHHGDAFLMIYSEVPQNLTVVHNPILFAGVTSFDVTANDGAFIALTVNGEIIGTGEATGSPVSITIPGQIPPNQVEITITKQNYYRYTSVVDVIPPSGPYVVQDGIEINDAAGNDNGIMETSEAILASLTVENVGIALAQNVQVTLSTADAYVTITNGTGLYGNIAAGATATLADGFAWNVGNNIPDLHQVIFEVNATDGNDTWTSYVGVQGHAPNLQIGSLTIDDANGNGNGRLDPGENATIIIQTSNTGSYHAIGAIGSLVITSPYVTLNNSTHNFNVIGAGLTENAVFDISISSQAPVGTAISLIYHVVSGGYNVTETFASSIGLIVEDWETGDMGQFAWQTGGNGNWAVSTQNPFEGSYCVKSGAIGHNQNTWLSLEYEVFANDEISFMYKVSSENNYDFLKFYINNNLQGSWSGEQGWAEAVYPVTPGIHTFKWVYVKDGSVVGGGDCAWIDYILLPAPPMTTAFAGIDGQTCAFTPYQTDGSAALYNLVNWTTSGNGTFNDPSLISPIYTPGTADVTNGSVTLTITAYGPDNQVSDDMLLTVFSEPSAIAGEDATVCSSEDYLLAEAIAQNHQSVLWITSGDGSFDDNQILNPTYTPGSNDITNGNVTLTITAYSGNLCGDISDQIILTIVPAPTAFAGEDAVVCSNDAYQLAESTAENYAEIEWSSSGDGTFDTYTALHPIYTPGVLDIESGIVLLTLTAHGLGNCDDISANLSLTIEKAPYVYAGIDTHIVEGSSITMEDAEAQYFDAVLWTTSGDGSFDNPASVNPVYTPGENDNAAQLVILTLTAFGNSPCTDQSDEMILTISPLGVDNHPVIDVTLFPNPSTGQFNVQIGTSGEHMISIKVYSISGAVVYEKDKLTIKGNQIEMIDLPVDQGVYFLKVEGEHISFGEKIIIRK
ncbi:MAG: T9SS type A sorting domain-containing protein, partial [Bacteroidales bacterium]